MKKFILSFVTGVVLIALKVYAVDLPESVAAANDKVKGATVGAVGAENCDNCELQKQTSVDLSANTNPSANKRWGHLMPDSGEADTATSTKDGTN